MVGRIILQLFCFSSPPSYISVVAPSLTLSSRLSLSHSVHYSVSFSSLSFFLPNPHPPSLSLSLSFSQSLALSVFQQIVFSSLLLELQPDASLILPHCQISLLVQAPPPPSRRANGVTDLPTHYSKYTHCHQTYTHTRDVYSSDACCRLSREELNVTERQSKRGLQ